MIRTIVVCDVCGDQIELKATPLSEGQLAEELRQIGWTQRDDAFSEVCPEHEDWRKKYEALQSELDQRRREQNESKHPTDPASVHPCACGATVGHRQTEACG